MPFTLDLASADLKVEPNGSAAAVHLGSKRLLMHCNRNGANLAAADNETDRRGIKQPPGGHAIAITGSVFLESQKADFLDIEDWQFGMIQVSNLLSYEFEYAGRVREHGFVRNNLRAAFAGNLSLDAEPNTGQSIDDHIFSTENLVLTKVLNPKRGFKVQVKFGDHPNNLEPYQFENRRTKAQNFLATARRDEGFVTYFVAREKPSAPVQFLARVGWKALWHFSFAWKSGADRPLVKLSTVDFSVGEVRKGAPPASDDHFAVAQRRTGPTANAQDQAARAKVEQRVQGVCDQAETWPASVAADFFS